MKYRFGSVATQAMIIEVLLLWIKLIPSFAYKNQALDSETKNENFTNISCNKDGELANKFRERCELKTEPIPERSSIEVGFRNVSKLFGFTSYEIYLIHEPKDENCKKGAKHEIQIAEYNKNNSEFKVVFGNLTSGNYCVVLIPHREYPCVAVRGEIFELKEKSSDQPIEIEKVQTKEFSSSTLFIIVGISLGCIVCFGICITYRIVKKKRPNRYRTDCMTLNEALLVKIDGSTQEENSRRIFLLHCFGDERIDKLVFSFTKVLEECFKCTIIHCGNSYQLNKIITQSEAVWTLQNIKNSDKIIVVESELACQIQSDLITNGKVKIQNNKEQVFLFGLINVLNLDHSTSNSYQFISVVRFSSIPQGNSLSGIVDNCRFNLPESLPYLYLRVHDVLSEHISTDSILENWKTSTAHSEFLLACVESTGSF